METPRTHRESYILSPDRLVENNDLNIYTSEHLKIKNFFYTFFNFLEIIQDKILDFSKSCNSWQKEFLGEIQRVEPLNDNIGSIIYFFLNFLDDYGKELKSTGKQLKSITTSKDTIYESHFESLKDIDLKLLDSYQNFKDYANEWKIQTKKYENYCTKAEKKIDLHKRNSSNAARIFNEMEMSNELEKLKSLIRKVLEKEVILLDLSEDLHRKRIQFYEHLHIYLKVLEKFREAIEKNLEKILETLQKYFFILAENLRKIFEGKKLQLEDFELFSGQDTSKENKLPEINDILVYTDWLQAKYEEMEKKNKLKVILIRKLSFVIKKITEFHGEMKHNKNLASSTISNTLNVLFLKFKYLGSSVDYFLEGLEKAYTKFTLSMNNLFNENKSIKNLVLNLLGQNTEFSKKSLKQSIEKTNYNFSIVVESLSAEEMRICGMIANFFKEFLFGAYHTLQNIDENSLILCKPLLYTFSFSISRALLSIENEKSLAIKFNKLLDLQDLSLGNENLMDIIAHNDNLDGVNKSPRLTFDLEHEEFKLGTFNCALSDTILLHGKLVITNLHLIFYSKFNRKNIFFGETVLKIPRDDILTVQKRKYGFLLNSIELKTKKGNVLFTSFISSNKVYELLAKKQEEEELDEMNETPNLMEENENKIQIEISDELKHQLEIREKKIIDSVFQSISQPDLKWTFQFPKEITFFEIFKTIFSEKDYLIKGRKFSNFFEYYKISVFGDYAFERTIINPSIPSLYQNGTNPEELANYAEFSTIEERNKHPLIQKVPFMPKECILHAFEKFYWCSHRTFIHETIINTHELPYCDTFRSRIVYLLQEKEDGTVELQQHYVCEILKKIFLSNRIKTEAIADMKKNEPLFKNLLNEFIKNSLLAKSKNKKQKASENEVCEETTNLESFRNEEKIELLEKSIKEQNSQLKKFTNITILLSIIIIFLLINTFMK